MKYSFTRVPIERIALYVIATAGILALVAVAPGMGVILRQFGVGTRAKNRAYVSTVLSRLNAKGYIVFEGEGANQRVRITDTGRKHLASRRLVLLNRPKKRTWDGYWRIVMFDIPERIKGVRNALRYELSEVGFKKLQASVWISPDECEDYIKLLKADTRIGKYLIYLKTKDIEYGATISRMFHIE